MPDQTTTDPIEPAQIAYQAYGDSTGWKNFLGKPMPRWEELPEPIKTAWVAAAGAIDADTDRRVQLATDLALDFGPTEGAGHKMWVIDQMLRALLGDQYGRVIAEWTADGAYAWDTGVAP